VRTLDDSAMPDNCKFFAGKTRIMAHVVVADIV
jgi:hypothetical protein